jgi:hypothetical protein
MGLDNGSLRLNIRSKAHLPSNSIRNARGAPGLCVTVPPNPPCEGRSEIECHGGWVEGLKTTPQDFCNATL